MNDIDGFVLNGGRSSRMGTAKGSLRIREHTLAGYAANVLHAVCDRVYIVGGELAIAGVEILPDVTWKRNDEKASILGLRSALLHCSTKYAAVLACDMPFVTGAVLERLTADISILEAGQADAIVPSDKNRWLQPLCAIYDRDRSRVAIEAYLETGQLQIRGLIGQLRVYVIEAARFADLENADNLFTNINTPKDMSDALRILHR